MNTMFSKLNFPPFSFSIHQIKDKYEIFDCIRKKYVALTPEEWVRQHVIHYLHTYKEYPLELMHVEGSLILNGLQKRFDLIVYNKSLHPVLLVECKQPGVAISQHTFDQISRYNMALHVPYLFITNGIKHVCLSLEEEKKRFVFHKGLPDKTMLGL